MPVRRISELGSRESRIIRPIQNYGKTDMFTTSPKDIEYSSKVKSKRGEIPGEVTESGRLPKHNVAVMIYNNNDAPYYTDHPSETWPADRWWNIDLEHMLTEFNRFGTDEITVAYFVLWTGEFFPNGYFFEYNIPTGESIPTEVGGMQKVAWHEDFPDGIFLPSVPPTDKELQYFLDDLDLVLNQTSERYTKLYIMLGGPTIGITSYFDYCAQFVRQNMDMECVRWGMTFNFIGRPASSLGNIPRWADHLARVLRGEFNSRGYSEI